MEGITYIENFITNPTALLDTLESSVAWDERMSARKTASYGKAYNYSQMQYPYQKFIEPLEVVRIAVGERLGFMPNNCLINYYMDGNSRMGFHSDQTDILYEGTGVAIVSIGEIRILRFRNIQNPDLRKDFPLASGSLMYMTNTVQEIWQHAIPKSKTTEGRMSLTFRKMR